jgi:hypothetical protein
MIRPVLVPREGAALFDRIGKSDCVDLTFTFTTKRGRDAMEAVVRAWINATDWNAAGGRARFAPIALTERSVTLAFVGTTRPRRAIEALISATAKLDPLEILFMRRPVRRGELGRPITPSKPREKDYTSEPAWWKASFARGTPPMSEDPRGMLSATTFGKAGLRFEVRPTLLGRKGLRIVYGLPNGVEYPRRNARAKEVTRVVTKALAKSFGGKPPGLYDAKAVAGRTFERISKSGRHGYVFALPRGEEMLAVYASCYRYREYELFEGLAEAVVALDLEPVVHWLRDHAFIVNLWERKQP